MRLSTSINRRCFVSLCRHSMVACVALLVGIASIGALGVQAIRADDPLPAPGPQPDPSDDPVPVEHLKPRIVDVEVFTDGIDQYMIFGSVTECDELEGISVSIGGIPQGMTVTTDSDGNFQCFAILTDASGREVSLTATCHEGKQSNQVCIRLP